MVKTHQRSITWNSINSDESSLNDSMFREMRSPFQQHSLWWATKPLTCQECITVHVALLNSWKQIINDQSSIFKIEVGEKIGLKHTCRDINHLSIHGSLSPTQYKCRAKTEQTNTGGHGQLIMISLLATHSITVSEVFPEPPRHPDIYHYNPLHRDPNCQQCLLFVVCVSAAAEIPAPGVIISWSQLPVMRRNTDKWMLCY